MGVLGRRAPGKAGGWIALSLCLSAGVCDPGDITIVPEFEGSFSFEGGLDGWVPRASPTLTPVVNWIAEIDGAEFTEGASSVRFELRDSTAAGGVWLERAFALTEVEEYRIDVTSMFGTDATGTVQWPLILEASDRPLSERTTLPTAGNLGPATTGGAVEWSSLSQSLLYDTAEGQDTIWVAIGVAARSADDRSYYLDDLNLVFTRR